MYRLRDDCNYKMIETLCSAKRLKLNITLFLESIDLNKLREFFFCFDTLINPDQNKVLKALSNLYDMIIKDRDF